MKNNTPNSRKSFFAGRQSKYTKSTDRNTILAYLKKYTATATMVCDATGVKQKNFTRIKRKLEDAGILQEVARKLCKNTNKPAFYLTTNPDKFKYPYKGTE